jgi:hypothetical protein
VEQIGQIAVFGDSQVGKTCFIEKVGYFSSCLTTLVNLSITVR